MPSSDLIRQSNAINTLRLMAALQVAAQHIFDYLQLPYDVNGLLRVLNMFPGVPIFFMLSGYLVWSSVEHSSSYGAFLKKRFLRIYPELWICVIFEILSLVFIYPQPVPLLDLAAFAFGQATVFQFWKPVSVTGYGCGTPNGSLWTIPVFITFYVLIWWVHKCLHKKGKLRWLFWLLAAGVAADLVRVSEAFLPTVLYKLLDYSLLPNFWLFLLGMMAAEYAEKVLPFLKKYWYLLLLSSILLPVPAWDIRIGSYHLLNASLKFFGWLGLAYRCPRLNLKTDISYELYIWHIPIFNAMLTLFGSSKLTVLFTTVAASFLIALAASRLDHRFRTWQRSRRV